jgi:hypothetical protein
MTLVRPLAWARNTGSLRFEPQRWGRAFRLEAEGGSHLIIRRHAEPEARFWLPVELEPEEGELFGLYIHPDRHFAARVDVVGRLKRAIGMGPALRQRPFRDAHRQAAMLAVHDAITSGASIHDAAAELLPAMPDDWRSSSERSDFRRLQEGAQRMVEGDYLKLLHD